MPKNFQLLSSCLKNSLSTVPRRLAVAAIVSATRTHGTVPAGWQLCFCLCKAVRLWAMNVLRVLSELPESRLGHQGRYITKLFTVEIVTSKQATYSSQQIATAGYNTT